ncbi:hypothetical protein Ndes2437A_g02156 [Nannochloris sp. 'desiccata']
MLLVRVPLRAPSAIARTQLLLQSRSRLACRQLPLQTSSQRAISTTRRCLARSSSIPLESSPLKKEGFLIPQACPACGQKCFRPLVLQRHVQRCCPDLLLQQGHGSTGLDFAEMNQETLATWLDNAKEKEIQNQEQALEIAFRKFDSGGNRLRQGPPEIATTLNFSLPRADRLLKAAMRAVPLPADHDPIEVIFEDDDFIALNKPYGVITAPKHRYVGGSMVNRIIGHRGGLEPAVLHRLDMNTTGVVLFAKKRDIVPAVHLQFREKTAKKEYIALVAGVPQWESCVVDAPIGHSSIEKVARAVVAAGDDGKPAVTKFTVVASSTTADLSIGSPGICAAPGVAHLTQGAALIRCEPLTGRTHQIRVHLAHAGHPILGDDLYGVMGPWLDRQALHAASLSLQHPRLNSSLTVEAPLPKDFENALKMVGL